MSVASKVTFIVGIMVIGGIIAGTIDSSFLGITFPNIKSNYVILHNVIQMTLGGAITAVFLKK